MLHLLGHVRIHIIRVHFLNGQLLLLVLDTVPRIVRVIRKPDALVNVLPRPSRGRLHPTRPRLAHLLVHLERLADVTAEMAAAEHDAQARGVFDGHARALALVGHHGVGGVAEDADAALLPARVGLVDPEPPGLDVEAELEVLEDVAVEVGVGVEEFVFGGLGVPVLVGEVAFVAGEEAVVGEELAAVAGGEDDLVDAGVAAPIFDGAVLRVVYQP